MKFIVVIPHLGKRLAHQTNMILSGRSMSPTNFLGDGKNEEERPLRVRSTKDAYHVIFA